MTRFFVLGNGNMLVCMDEHAQIRDFYYPHVGQENHVQGETHRFGIWIDGNFSWFSDNQWKKEISYKKENLTTNITAKHTDLPISLTINDAVHHKKNIYLRKVVVSNKSSDTKNVRLFFHQTFRISGGTIGDTVFYDPKNKAVISYKGKRYFFMNAQTGKNGIADYAVGLAGEYGKQGTFIDAEDGVLSKNAIDHGLVDSTIALHMKLKPKSQKTSYYWIVVGEKFSEVCELNAFVKQTTPQKIMQETDTYWKSWVNTTQFTFMGLPEEVKDLFKRSLLIIRTQTDNCGAIIAANDSDMLKFKKDTYSYMWPRDGTLISRALDRAGYKDITERFFKFCNAVITPNGYLLHKYRPDKSVGSSWHPWVKNGKAQLPIQEDETALVLYALWKHYLSHKDKKFIKELHESFIRKAADFLVSYRDAKTKLPRESYDLWEEKRGIHTFTCATVYAGLMAAAQFESLFGNKTRKQKYERAAHEIKQAILKYLYDSQEKRFIKGIYYDDQNKLQKDKTIDFSTAFSIFEFKILPVTDERVTTTVEITRQKLACNTPVGGYARYEGDQYYRISNETPGNPWFITTIWLADYYITKAQFKKDFAPAIELLSWVANHALSTGVLAEQLNPYNGEPLSVAPLTWSHAAFVIAVLKYLERLDELGICTKVCNPQKILREV